MSGTSLERSHPYGCPCAACTVRTALALIETGRPAKAVSLLERVPGLILEELGQAYARGHDDVVLARRSSPPPARPAGQDTASIDAMFKEPEPPPPTPAPPPRQEGAQIGHPIQERLHKGGKPGFVHVAAELKTHLSRLGPERVVELLRVRRRDLDELLEGRMEVQKSAMARLRKAEA